MSNYIIRFGYCPPNPGPKRKLKNKWYNDVTDAINDYNGEKLYISYNKRTYREITFEDLLGLWEYSYEEGDYFWTPNELNVSNGKVEMN